MLRIVVRSIIILFIIVSPYLFGLLLIDNNPTSVDSLTLGLHLLFYIPFIAITGMIVSVIVRKKENADILSLLGYAVPAAVVLLHELIIL